MDIIKFILTFLKIGVIGFGGGSALIPVIRNELVVNSKAVSDDEYLKHTVVANITPGALPVKLAATCGMFLQKMKGAVSGAYAVATPGVLATVLITAMFSLIGEGSVVFLNYASVGITVFIVFLLLSYILKTVKGQGFIVNISLCIAAFLLTGGRELHETAEMVFGLPEKFFGTPFFNISTIDLMIISFFMILLFQFVGKSYKLLLGLALSLAYAFFCGSTGKNLANAGLIRTMLLVLFVVIVLCFAIMNRKEPSKSKVVLSLQKPIIISIAIFAAIPIIIITLGMIFNVFPDNGKVLSFFGSTLISTITSFGGGEAYVAVADSVFVQSGLIPPDIFYSRIIPIANALPGPILLKVVGAIGFTFGVQSGSYLTAGLVSFTAVSIAIGSCSSIALIVLNFYEVLKDSLFIKNLKKFILPIICGTLISTSLAMIVEALKITHEKGINSALAFIIILVCIAVMYLWHMRFKIHDLIFLFIAIVVSVTTMFLI